MLPLISTFLVGLIVGVPLAAQPQAEPPTKNYVTNMLSEKSAEALPPLTADPFRKIQVYELNNGLKVLLAPSQKASLVAVRALVNVGYSNEQEPNYGVSHLLEHVLFRDAHLKDDMSYLQLIKEAGGQANGVTQWRSTEYYASIQPNKGSWLVQQFYKMMTEPDINERYVENEKRTVLLERGEPSPFARLAGFRVRDLFYPPYLKSPSFWERHFQVSFDHPYSLTSEQLSTLALTRQQVQEHYDTYYYPQNMALFITGAFSAEQMLQQIKDTWGTFKKPKGKTIAPIPVPKPLDRPHASTRLSAEQGHINVGYKVWGAQLKEELILKSYVEYLAHRLMKKLRNQRGETYTVYPDYYTINGYGYVTVGFETQKDNFTDNLDLAKATLREDISARGLKASDVHTAKKLALNRYILAGTNADSLMYLARTYFEKEKEYGSFQSPFSSLHAVSPEEYNSVLAKYLRPERSYQSLTAPNLFFPYDNYVFMVIGLVGSLALFRWTLKKPFQHDEVRWVRRTAHPPLLLLEALLLAVSWFLYTHLNYIINHHVLNFAHYQSDTWARYVDILLFSLLAISCFQAVFSWFPKKVMVMADELVIKSYSYHSKRIPLKHIQKVEARHPLTLLRSFHKVFPHFFWTDILFWRKGLVIELQSGKMIFLSIKAPEQSARELRKRLPTPRNNEQTHASFPLQAI